MMIMSTPFITRHISLLTLSAFMTSQLFSIAAANAETPPRLPPLITPETDTAIERGFEYLVRTQSREGAWRNAGHMGTYPVAMTSLAGLALLAGGNTTTEGEYAPQVSRALKYVLSSARPDGLISRVEEEARSMYGHGFSLLFLGQLYGMESNVDTQERIAKVLRRAIRLTAQSQSKLGGWYYTPESRNDEGSVTITQIQGLRSCRNAGIAVPKSTIDQAMGYLRKSSLPDGGIAYRAGLAGPSRPPITAAAVACWYNAGQYDNPLAEKALEFVKQQIGRGETGGRGWGHYYYAHFYMAQVMWLSGEEDWRWYFPAMRDRLLAKQMTDGAWMGDHIGKTYGTAVTLVILQIPYGYLPILQR